MPLVSNHMSFQKVEPSTGHSIPFNNICITGFVALHMDTIRVTLGWKCTLKTASSKDFLII